MNRAAWCYSASCLGISLLAAVGFYPLLPDSIPIHWNAAGAIDGWGSKATIFLVPAIQAGLLLLFAVIPWLSPKSFSIEGFRPTYSFIVGLMQTYFTGFTGLQIAAARDPKFQFAHWLMISIYVLFALMGNVLGRVRPNFFVGIRTPWTIASPKVWADTHRLAAWTFVAAGVLGIIAELIWAPFYVGMILLGLGALTPIVFSLVHYKRLEARGEIPVTPVTDP